jgi:hypothetical protein
VVFVWKRFRLHSIGVSFLLFTFYGVALGYFFSLRGLCPGKFCGKVI